MAAASPAPRRRSEGLQRSPLLHPVLLRVFGRGGEGYGLVELPEEYNRTYSNRVLFVQPSPQPVRFPFVESDYTYTYFNWPPWYIKVNARRRCYLDGKSKAWRDLSFVVW